MRSFIPFVCLVLLSCASRTVDDSYRQQITEYCEYRCEKYYECWVPRCEAGDCKNYDGPKYESPEACVSECQGWDQRWYPEDQRCMDMLWEFHDCQLNITSCEEWMTAISEGNPCEDIYYSGVCPYD